MASVSGPRQNQIATRLIFFVAGLSMASWAPLVPIVKDRFGLDEAQLGTALLCLGLGSILAMPFSGGLAARFGCKAMIFAALAVALPALFGLVWAPTLPLFIVSLLLFGAGVGTLDVVMNIQAVIVERESGRALMSGFHGLFSVGGIVGAGLVALLLSLGSSLAIGCVIVVGVLLTLLASGGLLKSGGELAGPPVALPRGPVILIGVLCFICFLAEGSVLDWSAVLLNSVKGVSEAWSGVGYVAFAAAMTLGRLTGDAIVQKLGGVRVVALGGALAAIGYVVAALAPWWVLSVFGFALVGAGASNVVPVLFSAAGRQSVMPGNLAISAVTTMGYAGLLTGPAVVGYVARGTSLPVGLITISAMLIVVVAFARRAATLH